MEQINNYLEKNDSMKIFYHGGCNDGISSALIFSNFQNIFKNQKLDFNQIIGSFYGNHFDISEFLGKNVYIFDFSFPKESTLDLIHHISSGDIKSLTIIDHHKTFEDIYLDETIQLAIKQNQDKDILVHLDMSQSGAGLLWEYVFEQIKLDYPHLKDEVSKLSKDLFDKYPLFKHIQDIDIWTKQYEISDAVANGFYKLVSEKHEFKDIYHHFSCLTDLFKALKEHLDTYNPNQQFDYQPDMTQFNQLIKDGNSIINVRNEKINRYIQMSEDKKIRINDQDFHLKVTKILKTDKEVINHLGQIHYNSNDKKTVALSWYEDDGKIKCSLRSSPLIDCSVIAKQFGGGGHAQASAFILDNVLELNSILKNPSQSLNETNQQTVATLFKIK